jgi:hypothetical protein
VEVLSIDYKLAQKIDDRRGSFQFIPLGLEIKELLTLLGVDENPGHLHLVVTARAAAAAGTQDEAENIQNKDQVGDIKKTYHTRTDTRFQTAVKRKRDDPS